MDARPRGLHWSCDMTGPCPARTPELGGVRVASRAHHPHQAEDAGVPIDIETRPPTPNTRESADENHLDPV